MIFTVVYSILFIVTLRYCLAFRYEEFKIVPTENGVVRGRLNFTLFDNKTYYSFLGIPYAKPPLKELRFKPPQAIEPWYIRDAFEYGNKCVQRESINNNLLGHEDCLFINVYTPAGLQYSKLAVIVFIHGGSYDYGYSNCYGPDFLIDNDVILVTFNYRVGPFGFLSLGTDEYPGNVGLKDQIFALKWVQQNIERFGGDKKRVTIHGQSAGAVMASLHTLTDASRGLFRRAILQSGSALLDWSYNKVNNQQLQLFQFAQEYGNSNINNTDDLMEFLQNVNPYLLTNNTFISLYNPLLTEQKTAPNFAPVIESKSSDQPFLLKSPMEYFLTTPNENVDILIGFNSGESLYFISNQIAHPILLDVFNKTFEIQYPLNLLNYNISSEDFPQMTQDIRQFYFGNNDVNFTTINNFTNLFSDSFIIYGVYTVALLEAKRTKRQIYYFENNMDTNLNVFRQISGAPAYGISGTTHSDDLFYVYRITSSVLGEPYVDIQKDIAKGSLEYNLIRSTAASWANFAINGKPAHKYFQFKPIQSIQDIDYTCLTNDGLVASTNPISDRMVFWDNFIVKYRHEL